MEWVRSIVHGLLSALDKAHTDIYGAATAALGRLAQDFSAAPTAIVLAFALGMVHALMPGHGKTVVFSYFLGAGARVTTGLTMAFKIAALHVGTAVLLVLLIGATVVQFGRLQGTGRLLETASYAAVTAIGAWLLYRALTRGTAAGEDGNHRNPRGGMIAYAVGLLPCPLTIILMNYALVNETLVGGVLLVGVMALGIGVTMSLAGLTAVLARRALIAGTAAALPTCFPRAVKALEVGAALAILAIGLGNLAHAY